MYGVYQGGPVYIGYRFYCIIGHKEIYEIVKCASYIPWVQYILTAKKGTVFFIDAHVLIKPVKIIRKRAS